MCVVYVPRDVAIISSLRSSLCLTLTPFFPPLAPIEVHVVAIWRLESWRNTMIMAMVMRRSLSTRNPVSSMFRFTRTERSEERGAAKGA